MEPIKKVSSLPIDGRLSISMSAEKFEAALALLRERAKKERRPLITDQGVEDYSVDPPTGLVKTEKNDVVVAPSPVDLAAITATCDTIRKTAADLVPHQIAMEILAYLAASVEEYIDNQKTEYAVFLCPCADEKQALAMPSVKALQSLYLDRPEVESSLGEEGSLNAQIDAAMTEADTLVCQVLDDLDVITGKVHDILLDKGDAAVQEGLGKLFKRLIFYYEMTSFSNATGPVIQTMDGFVELNLFYDPVSITQKITVKNKKQNADGSLSNVPEDLARQRILEIDVPEAFVCEITLSHWASSPAMPSM